MKKLSMDELNRLSIPEFKKKSKLKVSLILDDIRSMANVGSIFRTADCFRVEKIYLCGITPHPPHREIEKTALGATDSVNWESRKNILELIKELKQKDYFILALEQADKSILLNHFTPNLERNIAVILGNEVYGVNDQAVNLVDEVLEIPQFGTKHSFNVAVSSGIFLWDYFMKISGNVELFAP